MGIFLGSFSCISDWRSSFSDSPRRIFLRFPLTYFYSNGMLLAFLRDRPYELASLTR